LNSLLVVIKKQTYKKIEVFLKKLGITFENIPSFLNNPYTYIGCIDNLKLIIDISLRYSIGENFSKIQNSNLRINKVYNSIYNQITNHH